MRPLNGPRWLRHVIVGACVLGAALASSTRSSAASDAISRQVTIRLASERPGAISREIVWRRSAIARDATSREVVFEQRAPVRDALSREIVFARRRTATVVSREVVIQRHRAVAGAISREVVIRRASDFDPAAPAMTRLVAVFPNPFAIETTVRLDVASPERVTVTIFDVYGRRVRALVPGEDVSAGTIDVRWDGRDDHGHAVAAGSYFLRFAARRTSNDARIVRLR